MPKTKPIPDYSTGCYGVDKFFTETECKEIAANFGFKPTYNLYEELNSIFHWYRLGNMPSMQAGPKEDKEMLQILRQRTDDLAEILQKLSLNQKMSLSRAVDRVNSEALRDLENVLQYLSIAASAAKKDVPPAKSGPKYDWSNTVLSSLHKVYQEGTETSSKYTYNDYEESPDKQYSGPFFVLSKACLKKIGVTLNDAALAKRIHKITSE